MPALKIAAITTTDLTPTICDQDIPLLENGAPVASLRGTLISAEPYEGAWPIVQALQQGAQIVVTGRVADPSLFLAPMIHTFGWDYGNDVTRLARGSAIGHLLECGAQATGGYFGDPGYKDVPEPWNLPRGCSFAPRCSRATDQCEQAPPLPSDLAPHHRVACFRATA